MARIVAGAGFGVEILAFLDNLFEEFDGWVINQTSTSFELDLEDGYIIRVQGTGFSGYDGANAPQTGTVTGFSFHYNNQTIATVTEVSASMPSLAAMVLADDGEAFHRAVLGGDDFIYGANQNDVLTGGTGNDELVGHLGSDTLWGGAGDDMLIGGSSGTSDFANNTDGVDTAYGEEGNDVIRGGWGDDKLYGGAGDDNLRGDQGADLLDGGDGYDMVAYRFDDRGLTSGVVFDASVIGTAATVTMDDGWGSIDTLVNVEGAIITDSYFNDVITGSMNRDQISTTGGIDTIFGGGGDDSIFLHAGSSTVDAGLGDDIVVLRNYAFINGMPIGGTHTVNGGAGTDVLYVSYLNHPAAINLTLAGGSASWTSGAYSASATNMEVLWFEGGTLGDSATGAAGDDELYGHGGADILTGNAGHDILDGGVGDDTMIGGTGDDIYYVDSNADVVTEKNGEGADLIFASANFVMKSGSYVENLTLTGTANINGTGNGIDNVITGNAGNNILDGGKGNDTLIGGGGTDRMIGGLGDDTFHVDSSDDVVVEAKDQGTDTVIASVNYTLQSGVYVENLILTGAANLNGTGNGIANVITGNAGKNILDGGKGDDILDGGLGADTLIGGDGNDTFYVDNAADVLVETKTGGTDTVFASVSYALQAGSYVENLVLREISPGTGSFASNGTGNGIANRITGNSLNNILDGDKGDDILDGGLGADTLIGGAGNDTFYVDNAGDVLVESKSGGTDTVYASVNYALQAGSYVENLILTGSANLNGTGNGIDNVLTGNAGVNILAGGKGNDTYYVQNTDDVIVEAKDQGTDTVISSISFALKSGSYVENLTLTGSGDLHATGNGIDNVLTGNDGKNILNGGAGADRMVGGKGDDTYYVDNKSDVVIEAKGSGTGTDHVFSSVNFSLKGQYIEYLTLTGSKDIYAKGNSLDNRLVGNDGANKINGMEGQDRLTGGAGSDTFIWDATSHSKVSSSDRITDLSNEDFIDLSRIDANTKVAGTQHFVLVDAFTNTAGQVVLKYDGSNYTNLTADTDGDGVADMLIRIDGNHEDFDNFIFGGG